MKSRKALERAIKKAGSQSELARRLTQLTPLKANGEPYTIRQNSIWKWLERGWCPSGVCHAIQQATGVPVHELRPDVFKASA